MAKWISRQFRRSGVARVTDAEQRTPSGSRATDGGDSKPTDHATNPHGAEVATPSSLYLFGPTSKVAVGQCLDFPELPPFEGGPWHLSDRPSFYGWFAGWDPGEQRIWRLTPDDPTTVRQGWNPGFWLCRSATVVEELSPTSAMSAWDDVVALCTRLRSLSDVEAVRIASSLPEPDSSRAWSPGSAARKWVSQMVWFAARAADSPSRTVLGSTEDITDPAWLRVEAAAEALADGLAAGTATLAVQGAPFGPWRTKTPWRSKADIAAWRWSRPRWVGQDHSIEVGGNCGRNGPPIRRRW